MKFLIVATAAAVVLQDSEQQNATPAMKKFLKENNDWADKTYFERKCKTNNMYADRYGYAKKYSC